MKFKRFIVGFMSLILTTGIFYLVGYIFNISFLMFYCEYVDSVYDFYNISGSLVSLIIGMIVSFCVEKIYSRKYKQKLG